MLSYRKLTLFRSQLHGGISASLQKQIKMKAFEMITIFHKALNWLAFQVRVFLLMVKRHYLNRDSCCNCKWVLARSLTNQYHQIQSQNVSLRGTDRVCWMNICDCLHNYIILFIICSGTRNISVFFIQDNRVVLNSSMNCFIYIILYQYASL